MTVLGAEARLAEGRPTSEAMWFRFGLALIGLVTSQRRVTVLGAEARLAEARPRAKRRGSGRSEVAGAPVSAGGHGAEVPWERSE
ncbi:hypothetical protein BL253_06170 [Pseudofrankia asymbiotica]|uniref:Uncharacterized protein n=1 Tax=Pseudofrankia asymbiotica TaxID=1834516 RepID=A0A1V2IGQ0_9ACTN|nr:hypothetical protein BL253_06170 [Pseudofrankia asymbiotica]